jgi:hypothetical protein
MAFNYNLSLQQVADRFSQASFVLAHEGEDIAKEDLYFICKQLEEAQSALLMHANKRETEYA